MNDPRPAFAVFVSLAAVPLILLCRGKPNLREFWSLLAGAGKLAFIASMLPEVLAGHRPEITLLTLAPGPGWPLRLRVDAAGLLFALLASALWLWTSLYSIGYMRATRDERQTSYYACFAAALSATVGVAFAANLPTFFVFYELLTLATYPLVAHRRTPEAINAGRRYLVYALLAGQFLLVAVVIAQSLVPGAEFRPGGFLGSAGASPALLRALLLLLTIGLGVKAAVIPLHGWLPSAMAAPTPVSALLHAVAVVKAGAFGLLRMTGFVFGPELLRELGADDALACLATATILFGSLRALGESNLKRRLAYSTVSQLSFVLLGAALGSAAAVAGALFHVAAHAFMKITLFFCAGSISVAAHRTEVSELAGLGRRMPVTMSCFAVAALGLAGTPLLPGFVSKWNLALGAIHSGHDIFIAVLVVSALLNYAYFLPIVHDAFFVPPETAGPLLEPGPALWAPIVAMAAASAALGVFPERCGPFYRLAWAAARSITGAAP